MTVSAKNRPTTIREDEPLLNSKVDFSQTSAMPLATALDGRAPALADGELIIRSQRSWLVKVGPVKKHMFKGHLIRAFKFGSKRRKISVQVLSPRVDDKGGSALSFGRLFGGKKDGDESQDFSHSETDGTMENLAEHDVVWIKLFKKPKQADDDASIVTDTGTGTYLQEKGSMEGNTALFLILWTLLVPKKLMAMETPATCPARTTPSLPSSRTLTKCPTWRFSSERQKCWNAESALGTKPLSET